MGEEMEIRRDVELVNSQGLRHSLVLFWIESWKEYHFELRIDAKRSGMIGCDEEDTTTLSRYRTRFAKSVISLYDGDIPKGVIERVYKGGRVEISPDISFYSKEEYPHREFALTCGIRASFCFCFDLFFGCGVLEIVSTRNQDVGTLETFCKSLEDLSYLRYQFRDRELLQDCRNSVLEAVLEAVHQRFDLSLTQYWHYDNDSYDYNLVHQFSDGDSENLAPWFQFKDVFLHLRFHDLLGDSKQSATAFFCNNISALSITNYRLAHYARNCGSIACFTIYLFILVEKEEIEEEEVYALQFFLPSQEMDNDYPQNLLNSIWTTVKKSLSNCRLTVREREKLEQVLSVEVINSSSTQTEPVSFELGQPQSSLPHYDGSELAPTLKMFEKGRDQNSNSNSYEEAAVGETSKSNEASQPRRSEEYFKTKGNIMAAERDEHVEGSITEEAPYAISSVDIQNVMTSTSQPSRFQTKKTMCQQQQETTFIENEGDTSQQLPSISPPLSDNGTEQDEQVLEIKKLIPKTHSYEEISTAAASKIAPECVEQIIVDELEEEFPNKCNEPQSLTFPPRRSREIFGDEGYTVVPERVDNLVEVSSDDEDMEVVNYRGLRHSLVLFWVRSWKQDHYELTIDANKSHMIGCDEEDKTKLLHYWTCFANPTITKSFTADIHEDKGVIERVFLTHSAEMSPNINYYSEDEYPHRDFALSCGILASFCFPLCKYRSSIPYEVMEIVSTRNQDVGTLETFCKSFKDWRYLGFSFRDIDLQKYANLVLGLGRRLEAVCQRFRLPLTQYWYYDNYFYSLLHQFSNSDIVNSAHWCQFKDVCLRKSFESLLGHSDASQGAFFCRNISALSITKYPLAHYAQNCESIACFTIYLLVLEEEEEEEDKEGLLYLEFFLPSQELDNDYPQSLLNLIWIIVRESLPNCTLASGEELKEVVSVMVINSSTQTKPDSFEVGHPQTSFPHYESSEPTNTLKLVEKGPHHSSKSNSYEETAAGETLIRISNEASQPKRSEQYFKTKGKTMVVESDEPVEGSIIEAPNALSDEDIQNAMTSASPPSRFQTKKTLCQQQERKMFLENEGDTSQQLPCISQQLFQDSTEQDEQVLEIKKRTPNTHSYEEICTAAASKRTPECVEHIIVDELEEEFPSKCNEPQSLTFQPREFREIFGDEGYILASERGEKLGQVLSDKVINSTHNEPESFEVGHPKSSEFTRTLKLFEKGPDQSSNSNSYQEAAVGETSIRVLNEDSQPWRSEEYFKTKGKTVAAQRDNVVEVSPDDEDVEPAPPASKRLKKSKIPCTKENITKHFGRPEIDVAESFGLSLSTFKRRCRDVGIEWWESRTSQKTDGKSGAKNFSLATSSLPNRCVVTHSSQDLNKMSVKITYEANIIRFELPSSFEKLENIVIKKLHLDTKNFSLKYQDDEDDWVNMTCDEDIWECMKVWRSFKNPTIKMKLGPPINSYPG